MNHRYYLLQYITMHSERADISSFQVYQYQLFTIET
nr:MAG TPA: hypothetical protein [Caudoviricetes sp.]